MGSPQLWEAFAPRPHPSGLSSLPSLCLSHRLALAVSAGFGWAGMAQETVNHLRGRRCILCVSMSGSHRAVRRGGPPKTSGSGQGRTRLCSRKPAGPWKRDGDSCGSQECQLQGRWAEAASAPSPPSVGPQAGPDHPRGEGGVAVRLGVG